MYLSSLPLVLPVVSPSRWRMTEKGLFLGRFSGSTSSDNFRQALSMAVPSALSSPPLFLSFFLSFFRPLPLEEVRPRCVVVIPSRVCPVTSSFDVFRCNYDCSIGGETPSRQHLAAINAVPVRTRGERGRYEDRGGNGAASPQGEGEEEDLRGVALEDLDGVGCGGLDGGRD